MFQGFTFGVASLIEIRKIEKIGFEMEWGRAELK